MTESNSWCYSVKFNDENSFQQKRYRFFNKEVGEQRYTQLKNAVNAIISFDMNKSLEDNYKSITQEQWQKMLTIEEAKDFKEGFSFISGISLDKILVKEDDLHGKEFEAKINGKDYSIIIK